MLESAAQSSMCDYEWHWKLSDLAESHNLHFSRELLSQLLFRLLLVLPNVGGMETNFRA